VEKMQNYTQNGWRRCETTPETSVENENYTPKEWRRRETTLETSGELQVYNRRYHGRDISAACGQLAKLNQKTTLETGGEDPKFTLETSVEDPKTTPKTSGEDGDINVDDIEALDVDKPTGNLISPEAFVKTTLETSEELDKTTLETSGEDQDSKRQSPPSFLKYLNLIYFSDPLIKCQVQYGCKFLVGAGVLGYAFVKFVKRKR
jgi:hypothetical protein